MPVAAWQVEAAIIEHAHDLGHGVELQENLEHKPQPLVNRHIGILDDHAGRLAHEADRQGESELAALGLGKKTGSQATSDCVQFKLRYCSLQSQKQPAVGAGRIIDAVAIGNEATAQATNIQQRVPVGAVARQPRHVDRQNQPDLAEPDPADEFLEAASLCDRRPAQAEIRINHVDVGLMPSEFASALAKRVLEPQAFLIAHHLVGCRLPDVDHGLARQMDRLDQFGLHEKSPPDPQGRRRQSAAAEPTAVPPRDLSDLCSSDSRHSTADTSSQSASILNFVRFALTSSGSVADIGTNRLVPPRCSTSYEGGKLPPLCDERQMTRKDRPYRGCRGSRT